MPSFTKKTIMETFLRLTEKKPPDKITVRDLVDECGINRNTFYYYFQDIYAVLEEYCEIAVETLARESSPKAMLCKLLDLSETFVVKRPRSAKMLAFSLGQEGLERYLGKRLDTVLCTCVREQTGKELSITALRFLRHAMIGLCLDVMRSEKGADRAAEEIAPILDSLFGYR